MEIEDILLKKGAEAAVEHVGKAVSKVTGSPSAEFGELLKDHIRFRRAKNLVKFYVEYQRVVADAGIDQRELPFRMWFPIFESVSIEEDETLQQKWAALLANAADPNTKVTVGPAFVEALKQLSPIEVKCLDWIYKSEDLPRGMITPESIARFFSVGSDHADLILEHLHQLGFLGSPAGRVEGHVITQVSGGYIERVATKWGLEFVKACRAPSKKTR